MQRIYQKSFRLSKLRAEIERQVFAVPQLQREFVWSARKACQLIDSIYRNFPIGTLLVWKTTHRNEGQLRKQISILPPYDPANREIYFLVDGQQRLSVLWNMLRGDGRVVENSDGKEIDFGSIYFDPGAEEGRSTFLYRAYVTGELADRLVPVVDLLSTRWRQRLRNRGVRELKNIANCRARILDYEALFVFCETNDLPEVRETFIRINSLGLRISAADRAFARASSLNLRHDVKDLRSRLRQGFERVSDEAVLQTLSFVIGGRDLGERAIDAMITRFERNAADHDAYRRAWPRLREAFQTAADYLVHDLRVPNYDFLPSEPMVTILALYFYHRGPSRPPPAAKTAILRWFWATAVGERYSGRGYRPNLTHDAACAERLAKSPRSLWRVNVSVSRFRLLIADYSRPGPLSNAFLMLLRLQRPRYLEDGTHIPLDNISSRRNHNDKHHVFPRALLKRNGVSPERYNSIVNICFLVARENQRIGQHPPNVYLQHLPTSIRARKLAMQSHFFPHQPSQGVWNQNSKQGFKEFMEQRTTLLMKAFERTAGMRLFERS